jgi:CHAT domain-containing protein
VKTLKSLRNDLVSINPENQFTFRESTEPVYREYVSLLLQRENNAEISSKNLELARETIDSLQLAELENFFRVVCLDAKPVVIDQVTDQKDPTAAVIYPILLEDRFEIIIKLPQQKYLRHYTTPIEDKKEVERIINELAQSLTQVNNPESLKLAQDLYNWLLRPAEKDLAQSQVKTLVFVLDSALRNIPMSVLHNGQQYLIEQYSIALTPSLQLVDPQPLRQKKLTALIAGVSKARDGFSELPHVPQELQQIKSQVPSSIELLNEIFTTNKFKNTLNSAPFSVIHLATHGNFSSQAEETFIKTWDSHLNIDQLNNLLRSQNSEPIELLVLSACETLTGDKRAALGIAGVAVKAGTRSTLATLWAINDKGTAVLMNKFYAALKDTTMTKANALRQAQLTLLNDPLYKKPSSWAAYVLLGNWL